MSLKDKIYLNKLEKTCRLCLAEGREVKSLYENGLCDYLIEFAKIEISPNDGLPQNSCIECMELLQKMHNFKNMIEISHKIIEEFFNLRNSKIENNKSLTNKENEDVSNKNEESIDSEKENHFLETFSEENSKKTLEELMENLIIPTKTCKNFICHMCSKSFICQSEAKKHYKIHLKEEAQICTICSSVFNNHHQLNEHKSIHKSYTCHICNKSFLKKTNLIIHTKIHVPESQKLFMCEYCGKRYAYRSVLNRHLIRHEKKFQCDQCDRVFLSQSLRDAHFKATHMNMKEFICEDCGKGFALKSYLDAHINIHNGKKRSYKCKYCPGLVFPNSYQVTKHLQEVHTKEKKYKCEHCGAGFFRNLRLTEHLRKHVNDRPYECEICDKRFSRSFNLRNHFRLHTGEKPFVCERCGIAFTWRFALERHHKLHN